MIAIIKPNSNLAFRLNLSTKIEYHPALIPSLNPFISEKKKKKRKKILHQRSLTHSPQEK